MANSHDRRKLRRAMGLSMLESNRSTVEVVRTKPVEPAKSNKRIKRLNRADSWSVLALLVGVFLVIVVPPLWLKAILLAGVCIGVFLFSNHSHWTHGWSGLRRYSAASVVIILLLAVGIPQFLSQWKTEHPKIIPSVAFQPSTIPSTNSATIPQNNGPTLSNVQIEGFGTGVVNHGGQLNFKDSKVNNNGVGIDNRNTKAQLNFDHSEVNGNKIGVINRGPVKKNGKKEVKQQP